MNHNNLVSRFFHTQDRFTAVKILAGQGIFEMWAPQRTSMIFGITDEPWASAAYRIDDLVIQLESHLSEWDLIAISPSGRARLVRHNTVVYELHCTIPPDVAGLYSNFFYRCPECNGHIYDCTHLLMGNGNPPNRPNTKAETSTPGPEFCPECRGKVQSIGPGICFCLDCEWEHGLEPRHQS